MMRATASIRAKLNAIVVTTTTVALAIAAVGLLVLDLRRGLADAEQDVVTQADVIALASESALVFDDPAVATENLSVLSAKRSVVAAALFDGQGKLFASYRRNGDISVDLPPQGAAPGVHLAGDFATAWRPVTSKRVQVGTIWLQVQHDRVRRAMAYLAMMLAVMIASLAVAQLLSNRLQRTITGPILNISEVARGILRGQGAAARAERQTNDEVGDLAEAFNAMLDELERRSQTLEVANKALKDSESRYQLAVRGSSAGLWDWNIVAGTMFYSSRFKDMLGYTDNEFRDTPKSVLSALHRGDRAMLFRKLRDHFIDGIPFTVECRVRDCFGKFRWFLIAGAALREPAGREPFRMAGSMVEVTERKEAERVLQESDRAKDRFLATLAHELRNPLAPIRTGLEILDMDKSNGAASERARETMKRQLGHMVRLIDDLLDISRISSGKIRLNHERTRLSHVFEIALEISRPAMALGSHTLTVGVPDIDIEMVGDPTRLSQAVGNLLNNAAKYTPNGGQIALRLRREGDAAIIEVEDNGEGIPNEMLDDVFSLFSQVRSTLSRSQGGLGIGLYLVRSLVDLHGGTVVAHSDGAGTGSLFTVRLPCLDADVKPEPLLPVPGCRQADGLRVLLVDDNVDAANTLAMVLAMSGCKTSVVHDGTQVVTEALSFDPDAILLDIGLPGMSGYEVAIQLRRTARFASTLLVAITGWGSPEDRLQAREAGFDYHLTKPVDLLALEPLLQTAKRLNRPCGSA